MPYCAVLECKNDSGRKNNKNGGVSYHVFPKDQIFKEKWIDATGRCNWMPKKSSTICSEHFLHEHFIISNKKYKYLKPKAIPTLKVVKYFKEVKNIDNAHADCSKLQGSSLGYHLPIKPRIESGQDKPYLEIYPCKVEPDDTVKPDDAHYSSSGIKLKKEEASTLNASCMDGTCSTQISKLTGRLRFCENKIKKQFLKIKRLQLMNLRLRRKITNMENKIKELEEDSSYIVFVTE